MDELMTEVFKVEDVVDMLDAYSIAYSIACTDDAVAQRHIENIRSSLLGYCPSYLSRNLIAVRKGN